MPTTLRSFRDLVYDTLSPAYRVVSVDHCDAVLQVLNEDKMDLVILDHLMPGSDPIDTGFEVCQCIRRDYPDLPIVVFSALGGDGHRSPRIGSQVWCPIRFQGRRCQCIAPSRFRAVGVG